MGAGMAQRLAHSGVRVICYDQAASARDSSAGVAHVECVENLAAMCARLDGERVILLMLPAGDAVEETIRDLVPLLSAGDTIVDGGNSYYRFFFSSRRRHTRSLRDWSSDVCSSDLNSTATPAMRVARIRRSCTSSAVSALRAWTSTLWKSAPTSSTRPSELESSRR